MIVFRVLKRTLLEFIEDDGPGIAAELAYRFLLALIPFFIFLVAVSAFLTALFDIPNAADRLLDLVGRTVPEAVAGVLLEELRAILNTREPALVSFGVVGTILAATGGMNALIKAMNRAYEVTESRPFWRRYLLSLGLTIFFSGGLIVAFLMLMAGRFFGVQLAAIVGLRGAFEAAFGFAALPIVLLLVLAAVTVIYWIGPNVRQPLRWSLPGSVLFAVGWLAVTYGFSLYVESLGTYADTYGALGGVVVLLIWFYLSAAVLILGAELNAAIAEEREPNAVEAERRRTRSEAAHAA
ncbi:MAG TPA: YihY/virulence factor BrkB family protein [Candidatus Limnocylindrales bacterium]|nr:YihY/virulence factor BrkB family protein [Candidatus Limnocylindrales bacterium]